jgi:hypothetical protein
MGCNLRQVYSMNRNSSTTGTHRVLESALFGRMALTQEELVTFCRPRLAAFSGKLLQRAIAR